MKSFIIFAVLAFLAGSALAQDQSQLPPIMQTDTTSGWQLVFSNPHYSTGGLQFFPLDTVYATAYNGSILLLMRSFDKGITWDTLSTPVPIGYVTFTSPMVGYSADDPSSQNVWKTTNGGQTWFAHPRNSVSYGPVVFANKDTGVIFSSTTMARTTNGGETWKEISRAIGAKVNAGSFGDSKTGYGVGEPVKYPPHLDWTEAGYCEKTTDAGATWTQIYTGIPGYLRACTNFGNQILIVGGDGVMGRTKDGGINWDTVHLGNGFPIAASISFSDSLHGLVACYKNQTQGSIYATVDGGYSWQLQPMPNPPILLSVQMLNESIALSCGGGNIYRTTSGGNFSSVSQPHTINFQVQTFPNPSTGSLIIQYQLPSDQSVFFGFYNVQGVSVGSINEGIQDKGIHQVTFDGSALANGVYYFRLTTLQDFYNGSFTIQK